MSVNGPVTSEFRTVWGTIKVEFPAGMSASDRTTALEEMAGWSRAAETAKPVEGVD